MKKSYFILLLIIALVSASFTINAEPGSTDDPIVVLSYLEYKLDEIKENFNTQSHHIENLNTLIEENKEIINKQSQIIEKLESQLETAENQSSVSNFEIVELSSGQKLIGDAGTELIIRGGEAFTIASELGGLSDVTGAIDLKKDTIVPTNHLIIIPRSDGRGIYVNNYSILMISGAYNIIE